MAEPSEGTMWIMWESLVAMTTLEEVLEVVKQEKKKMKKKKKKKETKKKKKKVTKKKKKKVQKEVVALNKDDPPPDYENVENNGQCEGCMGDSVPCTVKIDKLIAWRMGNSGVKAIC
jgi:alpha-galactosidase/6-phospho-beta-glucosidase family protein